MAKEKSDKKDKKEKKEKKSSEANGVKKEKKEKKTKAKDVTSVLLNELESDKPEAVQVDADGDVVLGDVDESGTTETARKVRIIPKEALVPFANPLADDKQTKKVLKGVKKAAKNKTLKRGVKEVVKALRKSQSGTATSHTSLPPGVVILAADISPMDVISHLPVLCEDHGIPYMFVTSRAELGAAGNTKRPTSVVMVAKERPSKPGSQPVATTEEQKEFEEAYSDLVKLVQKASRSARA